MTNELDLEASETNDTNRRVATRSRWGVVLTALGAGVAIALAAGCGSSTSDPYPSVQSFCAAKANAECKVAADVCDLTVSDCLSAREAACTTDANQAVSEGRVYDSGLVPSCLGEVTTAYSDNDGNLSATDYLQLTDTCERVFAGSAKADQACSDDYDCSGTLVCDPIRKACGPSTPTAGGKPCNNPGQICDTGFYCGQDVSPGAVAGLYTCLSRPTTGQSCSATVLCLESDYCNDGSCVPGLTSGQSCTADDQCPSGYICDPYVKVCDTTIRFAAGATACEAYSSLDTGTTPTIDAGAQTTDGG